MSTVPIGSNTKGLKNKDFVRTHSESVIFTFDPQSADSSNVYFVLFLYFTYFTFTKTLCSCSSYHRSSVIRLHLCGLRKHLVQSRVSLSGQNQTSVFYRNSIIASEKLRQSNDLFTFQKYICIYMRIEAKRDPLSEGALSVAAQA